MAVKSKVDVRQIKNVLKSLKKNGVDKYTAIDEVADTFDLDSTYVEAIANKIIGW